jgi:hypothetical protein
MTGQQAHLSAGGCDILLWPKSDLFPYQAPSSPNLALQPDLQLDHSSSIPIKQSICPCGIAGGIACISGDGRTPSPTDRSYSSEELRLRASESVVCMAWVELSLFLMLRRRTCH